MACSAVCNAKALHVSQGERWPTLVSASLNDMMAKRTNAYYDGCLTLHGSGRMNMVPACAHRATVLPEML